METRRLVPCLVILVASRPARGSDWLPPEPARLSVVAAEGGRWRVESAMGGFTLTSGLCLDAAEGATFEIEVEIRVGVDTRALPELACYDTSGREIPARSALANAAPTFSTNWQRIRRTFVARAGTASARARIRGDGRGSVEIGPIVFRPTKVDTYQTGSLVEPLDATLRKGLVLDSNHGIVNRERLSTTDLDGDGAWARVSVDLDEISRPKERGEDWRSKFEVNPNAIFWSDGTVLKSDTVREDRRPDLQSALRFRAQVRPGPYRVFVSDPGRAVSVSLDGRAWKRHEGGREIELGTLDLDRGIVEFWIDACHRDPVSVGPAYFDYVRLLPAANPREVDRLARAAARPAIGVHEGSVDERRVEVRLIDPPSVPHGWPVHCGFPVPLGELADADHVGVVAENGLRIPAQARVVATWPVGGVKWLSIDLLHDRAASPSGRYAIIHGKQVHAATTNRPIAIRRGGGGIQVDTGAIRLEISETRFGLCENVRAPDGTILQRGPIALEVIEKGGVKWPASTLAMRSPVVELAGPLHAVIRVETEMPASGRPASGFAHRARIHAFAGSSVVLIDTFTANTDSRPASDVPGSMSSQVPVEALRLTLNLGPKLLESRSDAGPGGNHGALAQIDGVPARVEEGEKQPRLEGWMLGGLEGGRKIGVGVAAFREQYPKAMRWSPEALSIDLWAPEGGTFPWIEGVGKTHHLAIDYAASDAVSKALGRGRALAVASPEWYCSSGAFGPIQPSSDSPIPEVERSLERHMRASVIDNVGLGFENHGDHSSSGYVKGSYLWDNNEYDLPAACLVHFARSGDVAALEIGLAAAQHYVDVDRAHYSSRHADWAGAPHTHSHGTFGHHTAQGPDMSHAGYVQGLILASYLGGNPDVLEGATSIAAWVLRNLGTHSAGMERQLGHPLMTLNDVYEATWDERWLRGSAYLVDQALRWQDPTRGGCLAPITESPAYRGGSPFCGGLMTAALLKFNGWAKLEEIDRFLERTAIWLLADAWRPPSGILGKVGSPRRVPDPRDIASHGRLLSAVHQKTGEPIYLVVPRRSVLDGFGDNARPFGTRATGLVFNYLPWFTAELQRAGGPVEDGALEARLEPAAACVRPGARVPLRVVLVNRGPTPLTDLRTSVRSRLDVDIVRPANSTSRLESGESRALLHELIVPTDVNPTCEANRKLFVHVAGLARREGAARAFHVWSVLEIEAEASGPHTAGAAGPPRTR